MTEAAVRSRLRNRGYELHKSRVRNIHADNLGGYMIVNMQYNVVVADSSRFNLDLEDVEEFLDWLDTEEE